MTSARSLTLAELRQRYPQMRSVERTGDSDEDNRQRYLTEMAFKRFFRSAIPTALIAAVGAITAYHYASGPADASPKFFLVRNVTSVVWGAWALYWIIEGWFSGYCLIPTVRDMLVGTKYDPDLWWIRPRTVCILMSLPTISVWIILFLAPYNMESSGSYSINISDGELINSIKIFIALSIMFVGSAMFVVAAMAYLRFLLRGLWRQYHG
jgi:hypothetical protein